MAWFDSFFGTHDATATKQKVTILDVITYLASLASNPSDIDPILDTVRVISSRLKPDEALSAADKAALRQVYTHLEHYLINEDPIRTFTTEEVLRRVHTRFPDFKL